MISFIIPTLNEEKVIETILRCIKNYSGDKEIIISDGNSTDKTIEISMRYTDLIVQHEKETRQTISEARNLGAERAHGEYLVFLDADTYIADPDNFFPKLISFFKKDSSLAGLTVSIKVLSKMETFWDNIIFKCLGYWNFFLNNIIGSAGAAGEFQMIRRSAFEKVRGFDEKIVASEDYELFRRLRTIGRTYYEGSLTVYHTGRRAHKVGWPRLLSIWIINGILVLLTKKSASKEWGVIR